MRECYSCGSIKTYVGNDGYSLWYRNKPLNQWLCKNCNDKFVTRPKWNPIYNPITHKKWNPINNPKRFSFRSKRMIIDEIPRTGYCSWCSNNIYDKTCKQTHLHHIKYHKDDPLKDTVELCASCHMKETTHPHFD